MEMDEVLVAIRHLAARPGVDLLQDLVLELVVFGGGLNHQLDGLQVAVAGAALDQRQRLGLVGSGYFFLL